MKISPHHPTSSDIETLLYALKPNTIIIVDNLFQNKFTESRQECCYFKIDLISGTFIRVGSHWDQFS